MSTKLILIRHGQTEWNHQRRYCGSVDVVLNRKGRDQAKKLSRKMNGTTSICNLLLTKKEIHKVYSSNLKRTIEFAKIALKDIPIERLSGLREMHFGIFEGLTYKEIMAKYPDIYRKWLDDPLSISIPKGESLRKVAKRVRITLRKILAANKDKTIVIFTHAGPLSIILCDILKIKLKEIWQMKQDAASISIVEFCKPKTKIHLLNYTSYLNE